MTTPTPAARAAAGRAPRWRSPPGGMLAALLIVLLALVPGRAAAQTADELQQVGARLRELGSLAPLPDSPLNRDAGDIAIIEHDGSSYDRRLPGGTPNYEARARVGLRFYETHPDDYDFLVVFTNFEFDTGGGLAFHMLGRNDVQGTGKPVGAVEAAPFGSRSRLKGWVDMASLARYRTPPYALERGGPDFLRTLGVLAHEMGHQWLAEARYKVGDETFSDLLGADEAHWSYLLDSDGSFLYGADWRPNGDGTWSAVRVRQQYSALDLYLMGLLPQEKVAPLTLLRSPEADRHRINQEDETVTASETTSVPIDEIVAALGPRQPDFTHSQKEFRIGFVFLTEPGTEPAPEDLEAVERVRRAFGAYFFALTHGVGWADTRLSAVPPAARAASVDLSRALAWLAARQALDGSWADAPETRVRDSATAVLALSRARAGLAALQRGITWLRGAPAESLDFQSRIAASLDAATLTAAERQLHLGRVLGGQNPDGGWGAARDFASDALDTALALRAMKALSYPLDARVSRAVAELASLAGPDGGWAAVVGGETSTVATAEVLLALGDWKDAPGSAALHAQGLAALVERQNPDGGFGSSPSTPQASALALEVLLRGGAGAELVEPVTAWLQQAQLADGSWASSPYQTALVVSVLSQSLGANLMVPAASLVVEPNPVREGELVRVAARVRNSGRTTAPASVARLHDGDPATTPAIGEAAVPELAPGAEADVAFDYATIDRPGRRILHVVADATSQVLESREDDNTTAASLTVNGLLADLVVRPEDVTLSPSGPAVGEEVTLTVTVRNAGERTAGPFVVLARVSRPSGATIDLPLGQIAGLGEGDAVPVTFDWLPQEAGPHLIRVVADAGYRIPESDETNADVTRRVRVVDAVPDGSELSVASATAIPPSLQELPQPIEVRAVVVNSGRADAAADIELRDASGESLGRVGVQLPGRGEQVVSLHGTLRTPGSRQLAVVVDPDWQVPEQDEYDNTLLVAYADARTLDVEVAAATLSAAGVELGERVTVVVEVRNRGTRDVLSVPVQLAHAAAGGPLELVRVTLSLAAGESRSVELSWRASIVGDAVPLVVRVDPFDNLVERREDNNEVPLALAVRDSTQPNLTLSGADVTLDPDPPIEGAAATLSALVRNLGGAVAGASLLRFVVGDPDRGGRTIGEVAVGEIAPGDSQRVPFAWPRVDVRGSLGLYVIADAGGAVTESNEDDNRAFRPFAAIGLPDLVLTGADVRLVPAYPREDETVTVEASVRNLGGLPSVATALEVFEGDLASRTSVGRLEVPALEPGAHAQLSLAWMPSPPAGERVLTLLVDPDSLVTEQDEGNNEVARRVVVQDADLFLSEPVFSPDGDGVKDTTTLAWRAIGAVRVVVSNARGVPVRSLVADGADSGSATWDGRDERGAVAWDGSYTLSVIGEQGTRLGAVTAVLDTNRSPIHDASPGRITVRNLTCALPAPISFLRGPAFMPSEDEVLYVVPDAQPGFPVGLLRASADGTYAYVAQDEWFHLVAFASPVSPDGQEVLVRVTTGGDRGNVYAVDLVTGERRSLGNPGSALVWSPDGQLLISSNGILTRDGGLVASLPGSSWQWSPSGDRLARLDWPEDSATSLAQVALVARDGTPLEAIPIPRPAGKDRHDFTPEDLVWRGDGKLVATFSDCLDTGGEAPECEAFSLVVDPETRGVTRLSFVAGGTGWSPDGSRYLRFGELLLESGASLGPLLPPGAQVAPRSSVATFWKWQGDASTPGSVCGGKFNDTFVVAPAANLAVDLQLTLLPGGAGLLVRGTATDRNLERFQLDYASQADPTTWHPIGAALDTPVIDDVLTAWVPPGPGSYVIRLSASDLAGHSAVRTRSVSWQRVPVLANFSQSDYYLSPELNGVKDSVVFRYTVVSRTRVDVRVVGPEPASPQGPPGREVWRAAFEHGAPGPQSFPWNGHDASDQVVADGRYTVFINDLPFRVEVDNTLPELGYSFGQPFVADAPIEVSDDCTPGSLWTFGDQRPLSSVAAERAWHVVDERLESWQFRGWERGRERVFYAGREPVFVAAPGPAGSRPRVLREDGRPADLREGEYVLPYAHRDQLRLEAWDLAGNHAEITVEPPGEALFPLGAVGRDRCEVLTPALEIEQTDGDGLPTGRPVSGLRPVNVAMQVGSSLRATPQDLELVMQPLAGGAEHRLPAPDGPQAAVIIPSFEALGIDPTLTYRGRFTGQGETGPVASAPFVFSPCQQWLRAVPALPEELDPRLHVLVLVKLDRAVESVTAGLQIERPGSPWLPIGKLNLVPMDEVQLRRFLIKLAPGEAAFFAPLPDLKLDCANRLHVDVQVRDIAGDVYPSKKLESACQRLSFRMPEECRFGISLLQDFPGCGGSPDVLKVAANGYAEQPAHVTIETGPNESPTILEAFDFVPSPDHIGFSRSYDISVAGYAGDSYPVRGRVVPFNPALLPGADASLEAIVDRTPPVAEFLLPPEGGSVCLAANTTAPPLDVLARFEDAADSVEPEASWRADGGDWKPLSRVCSGKCPVQVPVDRPVSLSWNAAALESGEYELRLQACDRSGNRGSATRRVLVRRDPPAMQVVSLQPRELSPNGDGLAEQALVTLRLFQAASLSARVHRGSPLGPPVRTLLSSVPEAATDVVVPWDGRGDDAQPVADGEYAIVFALSDACGGASETSTPVVVDTTPPEVAISEPTGAQRVSASIDVLGTAMDPNLASWELDLSCGGSDWTRLATRTYGVAPGTFLARWDTSQAPAGECRLRLVATDRALNRSPEVFASATVERGAFLEAMSATPEVFSPNGDGRRETATIGYVLARSARVFLELRDGQGHVVKTFESGGERGAGAWNHVWDGLTDAAAAAPEGAHVVWLRAEDPAVATVYEEKTLRLDLDRTPPAIAVSRPAPDGFASPSSAVRGSASDRNFATALVSATPASGAPVELARLLQGFSVERDMAPLAALGEGPYVLHVEASDVAENEARLDVPFFVDATPPRALVQSPADGAVLRRGEEPIAVSGLATDDHLASWTLRFGEGQQPGVFSGIGEGTAGGSAIPLGSWDVRFLPDGPYTLSLVATDQGGLTRESRVVVELDGSPPTVGITEPKDGRFVTEPVPIIGRATDAHLASWALEWAPGPAASAYRWSELARGRAGIGDGTLAEWSPLPPDGVYTLRLTATDEVDQTSSTLVTVSVDTTPPAPPRNLVSSLTRVRDGYGRVEIGWDANSEPDLAGYELRRLPEEWGGSDRLAAPAWDDGERLEGRYTYEVVAEDLAGNRSAPSRLDVLVDLTPPRVSFSSPAADASLSGAVDVRGTAWSADDFKEYRLLVGIGESPTAWTLLRGSSVGVAAGRLGEWLALSDGPHVLALEAEDTSGNQARVTRRVVVDTQPPEPPVLVDVGQPASPADRLVPSWQPGPSPDVVGTLVYRNGHLANSTGIVLGDRRGFVVPGTSYDDPGLPDGEHCYRVAALDGAGNESLPSNEICRTLDNRAPRALVVHPPDGTRFGFPVRVIAETPDLDVASVRFERRAAGSPAWVAFGELRAAPPWETTLDPEPAVGEALAPGPYELRAVATDQAGHTDPDPARITVVYGDTTPPPAPEGLVARVDGRDVALTWEPVAASDLAFYRVYRDGERIADGVSQTQRADPGLQLGGYRYVVTAVDEDGNESEPSRAADAVVYRVSLAQPVWPVVTGGSASVSGSGARPGTSVRALRDGAVVAQAPAAGDAFRIDGVPLVPDGNRLTARGEDAAGNRSLPSDEVVLISNGSPGVVSGLEAEVTGTSVALAWDPVGDSDLAGYVVSRDGERLTAVEEQDEATSITANTRYWQAPQAWDGNPATTWSPEGGVGEGEWTITFPRPVLVEGVRLRFGSEDSWNPGIPTAYTLLVSWQDRSLPVMRVSGNTRRAVEHHLPAPFLTTALTVRLDAPGGLAEVDVLRLDVEGPGFESFLDEDVRDGRHAYEVAAIDRYGALGQAGSVEAAFGDVDPPGAPTGLLATAVGRDVQLTWNANSEPDVTGYVVLRDGTRIATTPSPAWLDPARPNGSYVYTVLAFDAAGLESEPSSPAVVTVNVAPVPPPAPEILVPTDAAHPITLPESYADVAGRAEPGSTVSLEVNGELRGASPATAAFRELPSLELGGADEVALSSDGRWAAWSEGPETVVVQDLATGALQPFPHGDTAGARSLRFSPDGSSLAMVRPASSGPWAEPVVSLALADGTLDVLAEGFVIDFAWSPDGTRLAVSRSEGGGGRLSVVDLGSGDELELSAGIGVDRHLRWSPDGRRLAFVRSWWDVAYELLLHDPDHDALRVLDVAPSPATPPSWSSDGRRLAWTTDDGERLRVRVQEVGPAEPLAEIAEPGNDVLDPRYSPDGDWLSYVRLIHLEDETLRSVQAVHQRTGLALRVLEPEPGDGPFDGHEWIGGRLALRSWDTLSLHAPEPGWFVVRDVALQPGENRLVARARDSQSGLASPGSAEVRVTVPEGAFPDLSVTAETLLLSPTLPVVGEPAEIRVRVLNAGEVDAEDAAVRVRVRAASDEVVLETVASLPLVPSGEESSLLVAWTPAAPGSYTLEAEVDPGRLIAETSEDNNRASREIVVVAGEGLEAAVDSDRASYPAQATAHLTLRVANAGPPFSGIARTTVEDAAGVEVALVDERPLALDWGRSVSYALDWATHTTWAGHYRFVLRLRESGAADDAASASREFDVEPGTVVLARVRPERTTLPEGDPAGFALYVENRAANTPLAGATARLLVQLDGVPGPARFETVRTLDALRPGGSWEAVDAWSAASPTGRYAVRFQVEKDGAVLAESAAFVTILPRGVSVGGALSLTPRDVLAGETVEARVTLQNRAPVAATGYPIVVEVVSGAEATLRLAEPAVVDLGPLESRELSFGLASGSLPAGRLSVRLRGGSPPATLDVAPLVVHGAIAPPSPHAPQEGARVATDHPTLVVNDATSPEGVALRYEFEIYGDAALAQPLPGARGIPEAASRTSWTVAARLAEDASYWWRARASDGFSTSPWSRFASFTVDAADEPPSAPVPDTPGPGARVASRQPTLSVRNGLDPEGEALSYEFRLARDAEMTEIVAAQAGIAEGLGLTSWVVPVTLDEDASYFWSARAATPGDGPEDVSLWSVPVDFEVDTVNLSPSAPLPLRPVGGADVQTLSPALVVENATDPEDDPLSYRFEIDVSPSLDSPARQTSPELLPGVSETRWTPDAALVENTRYYWRVHASDGRTETPSELAWFFVDVTNEAPSVPVPLDPVDGRAVGTPTPSLCLRNATDPEADALVYDHEVRDASGALVARIEGVPGDPGGTTCAVVPTPLAENQDFTWQARASDGELFSDWSAPTAFRVDAVQEPPTAPVPLLPAEAATLDEPRPALVVENATSPDGLPLRYTFELERVAADGSTSLVERADDVPETPQTTAWTPSADLADGGYQWRVRASDPRQSGPWSATARFAVLVERPPSPPRDLHASAGDSRVRLDWSPSPESDVTGYRVYRATTTGGPYAAVGAVPAPGFDDLGLSNGVTYFYVVTALDASAESGPSNEAAARPEAPAVLEAEIRFDPAVIGAECLLSECEGRHGSEQRRSRNDKGRDEDDRDDHHDGHAGHRHRRSRGCPEWLYATLELPRGYDPATIDVPSLRAFGSVRADKGYRTLVDTDRDGIPELRVRFDFEDVAPHLRVGSQQVQVVGRAGWLELRGSASIEVLPIAPSLRVTPRTLNKRSKGEDVLAQLTFGEGIVASDVQVSSVRLNAAVPVARVVRKSSHELKLEFDRAAVIHALPAGPSVEVRVTGTIRGIPFQGTDQIRVIQ